MKLFPGLSLVILALFSAAVCAAAEPAKESMVSLQGFTGLLNTPNAHVSREGSIHLVYSDQRENIWRDDQLKRQENYLMSLGLFNFAEIGGRVTDAPGRMLPDLSASFKLTSAPLTVGRDYWPVVAVGIQDVGGGANQLQSRYVVISEDLWRFRLSAGYGFGPNRMKGGFGGVEFQAHDWVTLLGEYDTKDTSAGIRLLTPEIWKTPVQLTATFKSTLNHKPGDIDIAVGMTFPLDFRKRTGRAQVSGQPADTDGAAGQSRLNDTSESRASHSETTSRTTPESAPVPSAPTVVPPAAVGGAVTNTVSPTALENLSVLHKRLVAAGFINVQVGQRHTSELVVEYENTVYNHNELDALGVVAGIVSEGAAEQFESLHLVVKRKGIRVAVFSVPRTKLLVFMKRAGDVRALKDSVVFSYDTGITDDTYFYPHESGFPFPNTSLILAPGLQTFVATELGVFDYLLSFKPEILSNLWPGGVYQARWDIPLSWSGHLDDGQAFRGSRNNARMDRNMLFQGIKLAPDLMANLGAGMILHNIYGTLNEVVWNPGDGAHRLRAVQAWARNPDSRTTSDVYLGSYRYQYAPLDLSLEATGGKFWGQDRGFSLELKRFFADTAISTYYKNTTTAEGKHWQAAGIMFAFPLTPRKDLKIGPLQVRGADEWSYSQETTLAMGGQKTNDLQSQSLAINPQPTPALYRSYYNRDRLNTAYVLQHLDRLREAWLRYRSGTNDTP